jgi:hypothetical protein
MKRRSLLQWAASFVASLPFARERTLAGVAPLAVDTETTLRALARAILPASLGRERVAAIVDRFGVWTRDYRAGAELDHGYGHTKLRTSGASPGESHAAQLAGLDRVARDDHGAAFGALPAATQRTIVEAALAAAKIDELPERPDGRHVAADLLAFFFRSSEATDLCYGAAIDREACRGLPGSEVPPPKLGSR